MIDTQIKIFLSAALFLLFVGNVVADNIDRTAAQFFDTVMSPYCPGRTLSACPSDDARILRDEIRAKLAAGVSADEVQAQLKTRFGNISGEPDGAGASKMAYVGIIVFFVLGVFLLVLNVRGKGNVESES